MFLRITRSAFLIAGIALIAGGLGGQILDRSLATLTGQGATIVRSVSEDTVPMLKPGFHAAASVDQNLAGQIALGAIFMIIGFGMHAFVIRRRISGERSVAVHGAEKHGRDSRKPNHWILWMNVRM